MHNYMDQLTAMRMNRQNGHISPHKAIMMLAVIDLIASGETDGNRIVYGPELLEHFRRYFDVVKNPADSFTPILPFFHLRSSPFWHHRPVPGQEAVCAALSDPGGPRKLQAVVEYAFLDDQLFALFQQPGIRQEMREALICRYFPSKHDELMRLAGQEEGAGLYAQVLRGQIKEPNCVKEEDEAVRDLAFARVVKRAYHYQCAACGLRILFDGISLVDDLTPLNETTRRVSILRVKTNKEDTCRSRKSSLLSRSSGYFGMLRSCWLKARPFQP